MAEIRSVNGRGPRCGCGGKSAIHYRKGAWSDGISPETSVFLCAPCAREALETFLVARPDQPPYWSGDEERDETYEAPSPDDPRRRAAAIRTQVERRMGGRFSPSDRAAVEDVLADVVATATTRKR